MLSRALLLVLAVGGSAALLAQPSVATGELHGSVTDPTGAPVPAAKVTVKSDQTGLARAGSTGDSGEYRFLQMPPGAYDLQIEKDGFRGQVARGVRVTVGQIAIVDVKLELGVTTQIVEISGQGSLVESERSHQANTLEQESVHSLPINRRDYLTFVLLAPGVVDTTSLADNTDYRVKQTPTSGLSFYGSNGRGNSVTVDGGEANDDGGGVRPTISQEAVQEFQINRSNYSAELGGASGGVINIVSKVGTNQLRGSAFAFFRHESLDAGSPFANILVSDRLTRVKPPSQRQQFGFTLGGPLRKDRTFFFGGFEGLVRDESGVVPLLTDLSIFQPTPAQNAILNSLPAAAAAQLRPALTAPPSTMELFRVNSGVFPYTSRDWKFSGRLDHRVGDNNQWFFRYNYTNSDETNANLQALVGASRGSIFAGLDSNAMLGWTRIASQQTVNELRLQWNYYDARTRSIDSIGPGLNIAGFGFFNRDIFLPNNTLTRRYEIRDSLGHVRGDHNLKFGAHILMRGNHTEAAVFFPGRFNFGELPGALVSPALASTSITGLQAFNLGLPQTFTQGFGDPTVASTNPYYGFFLQDSWKVRSNLTLDFGLRYELDYRKQPLPTDTNNFAPRFAWAWDPFNDKKTTVRGGYGIFYAPIYYQIDYVVNALNNLNNRRQIAQVTTTIQTAGPAAAQNIYQTLRRQGVVTLPSPTRAITAADLAQFGIIVSNSGPVPPLTAIFINSPDYVNPYSQQASLAIERELVRDLSVSIGYTYVRTLKIGRAHDLNPLPTAPINPLLGIKTWANPAFFQFPTLAQYNAYESTARAFYSGAILEVRKRFSRSFSLSGNYTFSRAIDEVTDYNSGFQPNDQTNLRAERGLSAFDQRHKVVIYGIWAMPGGVQWSPLFRANSARPFNLLAGADLNSDRHSDTDRPPLAGRNTGKGPDFRTFDMRLSRKFSLGSESRAIELMGEAFNLLNRLNFSSLNNSGFGAIAGPFNLQGRHDRTPSQPLGFTGAFDPRRLQLGVRITW